MAAFRWTDQARKAAQLIARGNDTYPKVARKVGVTRQTLHNWRRHPDFQARVEKHLEEFRATVRRRGLAILERRVDALNDRWNRMQQVIESRAIAYADDAHGGQTGMICRKVKGWEGSGDEKTPVYEYEFDAALARELREHEKQAAQELGQWTEKHQVDVAKGYDVINSPEEL